MDPGEPYPAVVRLAIAPGPPSVLYFASFHRVLKSADGGRTWTRILDSPWTIYWLAAARTGAVYAGLLDGGGILRSNDGGVRWASLAPLPDGRDALSFAAGAGRPATLWAASYSALFKSTDRGASWRAVSLDAGEIKGVAAEPALRGVVHVSTERGFKTSRDGGATWTPFNGGLQPVALAFVSGLWAHPALPGRVYLAARGAFFEGRFP